MNLRKSCHIIYIVLLLAVFPSVAISSGMEFAQMTDAQLIEMDNALAEEMLSRGLCAYISISGKKYHTKPDCSGMEASMRVLVNDLEYCGYEPCKRCAGKAGK